jgi:hypothetical protein
LALDGLTPLGQPIISVNPIGQPMPARYAASLHRPTTSADVRVRSCRCSPTLPKATGLVRVDVDNRRRPPEDSS